uniref:TMV resistance protein N n=1 Tax=Cajanus cajan TaxID=3821 RepID=A0A151SFP6_CAJCA|nr:TMV resistance protein N [Cajanus cajan]
MVELQIISDVASSSSPSSMVSSKKYKVFLSFRGEDTRMNFTSHLYEALKKKEVETFIDYELRKGDEISPALIQAIENSLVSIVILSPNYASSKWCLEELSKTLEYPSHVRKQTGSYEQAFAKHKGESNYNKWKAALNEIANLAGWDSRNRTESELLKEIVGDVLQKLTPTYQNQLKGLVGIEDNYEKIESLLKIGSTEVITIGIWGMGGKGKTTLATTLYARLSPWFEGCCFLKNVRENSSSHGYEDLSRSVVSYYKGVPLALKVLGASLRRRSKEVWEISGIEVLLDKALITISNYNNSIEMHDLIQQMGQEIVHQESIKDPGRRSLLWKHDEVYEVLKYNKGTDDVEGIILNLDTLTEDLCLSSDFLAKMPNVRFLKIYTKHWSRNKFNVSLPHGLKSFSYKLRYLRWDGFCLESLSCNFCAEQLVELHLSLSKVKRLWDGVQDLSNLKKILLDDLPELVEIPNLSMERKLELICLIDCISLRELHPSITSLPKLTQLELFRCSKIEILKVHSKSLRILDAYDCSSLKEFSITSKEMTTLTLWKISGLSGPTGINDVSLCASIQNLSLLKVIRLKNCQNLMSLPQLPPSLKVLELTDCRKLVSLPQLPPSLKILELNDCRKLVSLPQLPPSLDNLELTGCRKLVSLPQLPPSVT